MPAGSKRLVALVTHARQVPSAERQQFALAIREWSAGHGGFVLETCHRVEAYGVLEPDQTIESGQLPAGGVISADETAVRHAVSVAVGRDSVVVGEDQILHQLREALTEPRDNGTLDPSLDRLFAFAFRAGRRARSWRQGRAPSLADIAIAAIERRTGSIRGRPLLVVGAGKMGALVVQAGLSAGAAVSIASRTATHADELAARLGVGSVPFDPGEAVRDAVGLVVALNGRWTLSQATNEALLAGGAVVIDLSVPSAMASELEGSLGQRLVSADALALGEEARQLPLRNGEVSRLDALIDSTTAEFVAWSAAHVHRATAEALAERADAERQAELAELWRRLPALDPESRELIEGMSRHLATRLLREPLERLGHDPDGRTDRQVRELFGL